MFTVGSVVAAGCADEEPLTLEWGDATLIEFNGGSASNPQVSLDSDGNAIAVWAQAEDEGSRIWANRYGPTVGWSTAEPIEPPHEGLSRNPRVAVSDDGTAIVVWENRFNIWSNRFTPSTGWGTAELIESNGPSDGNPQVAIDVRGGAIATWGGGGKLWSSRFTRSKGWGVVQMIAPEEDELVYGELHELAMDSVGNAIVVWSQSDAQRARFSVWASRFTQPAGWSAPVRIDSGTELTTPHLAVNPMGDAIAAWARTREGIWASRFTPTKGWGGAERIYERTTEGDDIGLPMDLPFVEDIALDPRGNAIVIFSLSFSYPPEPVSVIRFAPDAGWSEAVRIGDDLSFPRIVIDPKGRAVAVWIKKVAVWASRFLPAVGWEDPETVGADPTKFAGVPTNPSLAMDRRGRAVVVWQQPDWLRYDIWANHFGGTTEVERVLPTPPVSVEQTCKAWCDNDPKGPSCYQGPSNSIPQCNETCLRDYQTEASFGRGEDWIAIKECQLVLECDDSYTGGRSCDYVVRVTDQSDFEVFDYLQGPWLGFCPDLTKPKHAVVEEIGSDEYELRFSTTEEVEDQLCEPPLYLDLNYFSCWRQTDGPSRILSQDEVARLKEAFSAIIELRTSYDNFGCDLCGVSDFGWDGYSLSDNFCDLTNLTWIHPHSEAAITSLLGELTGTSSTPAP